jgi:hypothetical protein
VHHFIGRADLSGGTGLFGNDHEHEDIRTHIVAADEAIAWAGDGRVRTATGVITLLWLALHRERLRRAWAGRVGSTRRVDQGGQKKGRRAPQKQRNPFG